MKKIISLICAAILLFSFSAVAYADYAEDSGNVMVSAVLGEFTPIGVTDIFESHTVEGKTTIVEGRTFKIVYTIENKSDKSINAEDVLKDFKVVIINENTEKVPAVYSEHFIDKTNIVINPNESKDFTYEKKVETKESVKIYIEFKGKNKDIQSNDCSFSLEYKEETSTTVTETSTTTTTTEATKPVETSTTTTSTTTESTKSNTAVIIMDLPDSPNTDAPIEDEIPNTGSTKAIYAAAALAIAGAVALLIIKKKSYD